MTNTNDFSKKDMEDIITDIDSKKEGFSISGAREEVMLDRFALPFYKFIDNAVFENTKKKSNANYGYGYGSNNYNYSAYLNFILKNKDSFFNLEPSQTGHFTSSINPEAQRLIVAEPLSSCWFFIK